MDLIRRLRVNLDVRCS